MSAVAGSVYRHVAGLSGNASLKNSLESTDVIVVLLEGKVIYKDDKFQGVDA